MTNPNKLADALKLIGQMRDLLRANEFDARGYCLVCSGWMCSENGCTPKQHTSDCLLTAAVADATNLLAEHDAQPAPAPVQVDKRDREADRVRFPDAQFNSWLDDGISDCGHTVWDTIGDVCDAWHGWSAREFYAPPPAPAADGAGELPPIERDEAYERDYIPLPGGWEIQTKGKGSTFRVCDTKTGERAAIPDERLHPFLERMAREVRAAIAALRQPVADAVDLEQFRDAVVQWQWMLENAAESQSWMLTDPDHIADVAKAKRLLALIASQQESRNAD